MKPFVVNRYGRIVFPFNFFPALDFSVFQTLDQFAAVIKRDFEEKAPTETDIVARVDARAYNGRYDLLRDLALNLFWVNRYALTMYEKRPMRWRDVARQRDDLFLPIFKPWEGAELATAIEAGYRGLPPTWDEGTEDKVSRILLDVFRHKKGAGAELPAIKPTVSEILSNPQNLTYHLLAYDADYPGYGYDDIIEYAHPVPELEALMRQAMVLHNQYRWDRSKTRVIEVGKLHDDDFVVVFYPRNDDVVQFIRRVKGGRRVQARRPAPAPATPPVAPYPAIDVRRRFAVMPRVEALAVYAGELVCTNDDLIRNTAYCWSRMIFGDGAAALVVGPAPAGAPPDIEWFQTYASGPMSEVDSIIWPNPEFDNNITVYGPEVKALVKRYLSQMIAELGALPHPDGGAGSLLDAIELIVPHQANKTMVLHYATAAGVPAERLYFNIEKVGNTSSASIPLAIHDAVREGVIDRPVRVFAPGFGAGAVGGYVVMRVDPAKVAVEN